MSVFSKSMLVVLVSGAILAGCSQSAQSGGAASGTAGTAGAPAAAEKQGDTTKTGVISQAGSSFFIQETGGQPEEIESYNIDLSAYVGQTVTAKGQYSGDTLFVATIE